MMNDVMCVLASCTLVYGEIKEYRNISVCVEASVLHADYIISNNNNNTVSK